MYQPGSQEETEFNSLEEASLRDPSLQRGGQGWETYCRMWRHPRANTEQRTVATTRLEGVRKGRVLPEPRDSEAEVGQPSSRHIGGKSRP